MSDEGEKKYSGITDVVDINKNQLLNHSNLAPRSEAEKAKAWIVKALVIIFGSTIGCCFVLMAANIVFPSSDRENFKDIITLILVIETVVLATVLGFYFSDRSKS